MTVQAVFENGVFRPVQPVEIPEQTLGNAAARRSYRGEVTLLRTTMTERGEVLAPTPDESESAWKAYGQSYAAGA